MRDVQRSSGQVVVEHGEIRGLMPPMTMNFDVPDPELLARLARGQIIDFAVTFDERGYHIVAAEVIGVDEGEGGGPTLAGIARPREPAPGFALTDQAGRGVRLEQLRGRAVLLDFVYTSCPGPCPVQTSQRVTLQRMLPDALRERVWFVSISLDPERDTPEAMADYASERGADFRNWSFLTGGTEAVAAVLAAYGVGSVRQANGEIDHLTVTFLIDGSGRIAERYVGLDHAPEDLLRDLERIAPG